MRCERYARGGRVVAVEQSTQGKGKEGRRARAVGGVDGMRGGERGDQVAGAGVRFGGLPPGKEKVAGCGRWLVWSVRVGGRRSGSGAAGGGTS